MVIEDTRLFGPTDETLKHRLVELEVIITIKDEEPFVVDF